VVPQHLLTGFVDFPHKNQISVSFGIMPLIFCTNKILNNQIFLLQSSAFQVYEDNAVSKRLARLTVWLLEICT